MNTINVVSLKDACLKMNREENEVRKLIRRYPALAPQKILGRMACTPEWMEMFGETVVKLAEGMCLNCGRAWDVKVKPLVPGDTPSPIGSGGTEPAPETPEDG